MRRVDLPSATRIAVLSLLVVLSYSASAQLNLILRAYHLPGGGAYDLQAAYAILASPGVRASAMLDGASTWATYAQAVPHTPGAHIVQWFELVIVPLGFTVPASIL